jgi:ATP-dependent DNA helicase RecG
MVMTATPIPRTLALTLYGDLDVSVIDELPPGRKPIKTRVAGNQRRLEVYHFLSDQLRQGRQIYFVYPLIAESEKSDLKAAEEAFVSLAESFPAHRVGLVHGKMKPDDKERMMLDFKDGKIHILVSTTVIEVGVDVPNATVMVIENAERFGLSQLHQLRGRVGRGGSQSYCILMVSEKISRDGRERLKTMEETNDGFKISEVDLKLRGPGDFLGTRQSGLPDFKIANIAEDGALLSEARSEAEMLMADDPNLIKPENADIKAHYQKYFEANRKFAGIA